MRLRALPLLLVLSSPAAAQDSTVTLWTREVVKSSKLNEDRVIYVATPDGYRGGTGRYSVLVLLDGEDKAQLNLAIANVAFLANRGAIPPMIVVGVTNGSDRTRDLRLPPRGRARRTFPPLAGPAGLPIFSWTSWYRSSVRSIGRGRRSYWRDIRSVDCSRSK